MSENALPYVSFMEGKKKGRKTIVLFEAGLFAANKNCFVTYHSNYPYACCDWSISGVVFVAKLSRNLSPIVLNFNENKSLKLSFSSECILKLA